MRGFSFSGRKPSGPATTPQPGGGGAAAGAAGWRRNTLGKIQNSFRTGGTGGGVSRFDRPWERDAAPRGAVPKAAVYVPKLVPKPPPPPPPPSVARPAVVNAQPAAKLIASPPPRGDPAGVKPPVAAAKPAEPIPPAEAPAPAAAAAENAAAAAALGDKSMLEWLKEKGRAAAAVAKEVGEAAKEIKEQYDDAKEMDDFVKERVEEARAREERWKRAVADGPGGSRAKAAAAPTTATTTKELDDKVKDLGAKIQDLHDAVAGGGANKGAAGVGAAAAAAAASSVGATDHHPPGDSIKDTLDATALAAARLQTSVAARGGALANDEELRARAASTAVAAEKAVDEAERALAEVEKMARTMVVLNALIALPPELHETTAA